MQIDEQKHGAVTVLRPRGSVAGDDAKDFAQRLVRSVRESLGRVVLDASAVSFVDSLALEALLDAGDALEDMGQTLRLCGVSETVREVLELTGVAQSIEQYATVSDAVRSFL